MSTGKKLKAPPMVYIKGEEMTKYTMELVMDRWINKYLDTSAWASYDLSCAARDASDDQVLHDAVAAGAAIGAIFKEPTITPTAVQQKQMGLKKAWGSPNGAMRRGWNGITISRDTIHIDGIELGFKKPVFFERHAVGGEYGAGWKTCGKGKLVTTFLPDDDTAAAYVVDSRTFSNDENVAVVYHNPLDNVQDLAHHFFSRCLAAHIVPYVVTKKNGLQVARRVLAHHERGLRRALQGPVRSRGAAHRVRRGAAAPHQRRGHDANHPVDERGVWDGGAQLRRRHAHGRNRPSAPVARVHHQQPHREAVQRRRHD